MDAPGVSDSAVSISQLAAHTSSSTEHLYRLLRCLAQFGIFEELPEQHFKLTSMG
jgi:DNA-binding IclR family transcriptional regulator